MDISEELKRIEYPWRCEHPETEPRLRTLTNKTKAVYLQCLRCGSSKGSALPRSKVKFPIADWDESLAEAFATEARQTIEDQKRAESDEWWRRYHEYMRSEEWREKRAVVMKRAGGMCEGCGRRPAVQAHHLSYKHFREEFLWELKAVCMECHERVKANEIPL